MACFGKNKLLPVPALVPAVGSFMSISTLSILSAFSVLSILSGCSRYSVSINDNTVYSPPGVFTDFSLPDKNLQDCIDDTIADEHLTKPEQLIRLFCTNRAIYSLEGLEIFDGIQYLGLEDNQLESIVELASLPELEQVNLAGNPVVDAAPLLQLQELNYVDFTNNPALDCSSLQRLTSKGVKVENPDHCRPS